MDVSDEEQEIVAKIIDKLIKEYGISIYMLHAYFDQHECERCDH